MKNFYQKGINLLEVTIGIAVLTIILVIVLSGLSNLKQNQLLKNTETDIITSLNKAQTLTKASLDSSEYGINFSSNQMILFKGTTFLENDPNNEIIEIPNPVAISNISLSGGATSLYFNRLSGLPSNFGSITISVSGTTKTISISSVGVISSN